MSHFQSLSNNPSSFCIGDYNHGFQSGCYVTSYGDELKLYRGVKKKNNICVN